MKYPGLCKFSLLLFFLITAGIVSQGCGKLKPERDNEFEKKLPSTFSLSGEKSIEKFWWKEFGSEELNSLVEEALKENLTLKEAWLRLQQADAVVIKSRADLQPTVNLNADASRKKSLENVIGKKDGKTTKTRTETVLKEYALGLAASYELDLWGRIRDSHKASTLLASASYADLESAAVTIAASITEDWINICEQRSTLKLLKKQLELNKKQLELIELRQRNGIASALDVYQQKQILAQTEAQIPLAEAEEQATLHRIAILLGKPPRTKLDIKSDTLPEYTVLPATGLMAETLKNRPDLRAARMRIESADWNVASAKADRLPAITLTGSTAFNTDSTGSFSTIFENWYLNLAAGLTAPLWDGHRRKAEVMRLKAEADRLLVSYRQQVLEAIKEVEDAILNEKKQYVYLEARLKQAGFSSSSYEEAKERYLRGMNDYLPVLQALESLQNLEREIIQIKAELLMQRVALFRSLGSTWTTEIINENFSATERKK